jgi:hypothetical protein
MKRIAISIFIVFYLGNFTAAMQKPSGSFNSANERMIAKMKSDRERDKKYAEARDKALYDAKRKFEFSNQSDQYVTVWIPTKQGCWHPTLLYPYTDSGIINPLEHGTFYIYTKAAGHFIMQMGEHGSYRLINETPNREVRGHSAVVTIKSMPYDQMRDIVVVTNPDGSVTFSKRNP